MITINKTQKSNVHLTPEIVYEKLILFFGFVNWFDPCPVNPKFDGLIIKWKKWNFVNPPYDQILDFILKAFLESLDGKVSVFLLPVKTTSLWWKVTDDLQKFYFPSRLTFSPNPDPSFQDHCMLVIQ